MCRHSAPATGSICETDLSGVVSTLSALSVEWQDTFLLQAVPMADSLTIDIDSERINEGGTYVEDINGIRFDPLPPPGASILVRYTLPESTTSES